MTKFTNTLKMLILTVLLGATTGAIIWCFMRIVSVVFELIWTTIPEQLGFPYYPVVFCAIGGAALGLLHRKNGDYPDELPVVIRKIKNEKHYDYSHMFILIICAMIPLAIGASVGPEAGLTGIIAGLCYWVGDNVKYAREHAAEYSHIGAAATLGSLFHAPLFGIFVVEETAADEEREEMAFPKSSKLLLYGLSIGSAFMITSILSHFFGRTGGGLRGFDTPALGIADFVLMIVYILVGLALFAAFAGAEYIVDKAAACVPVVVKEVIAGVCMGIVGVLAPMTLSSGEEQMGSFTDLFTSYAPLVLIGLSLLKIVMTAFCIKFGLKGGHFFPFIFACSLMGFGISMLIFPGALDHAVFAAAIVNGAALGAQIRKPIAVAMLLLLCFPLKLVLFTFVAAAIGARIAALLLKRIKGKSTGSRSE